VQSECLDGGGSFEQTNICVVLQLRLMRILNEIATAWGWKGVRPRAVIMQNAFGNVIFTDDEGRYWRVCPEDLSCDVIAADSEGFEKVQKARAL